MHAWVRPRRVAALVASSLAVVGCTSLLGIDGTYVSRPDGDAGTDAAGPVEGSTGGSGGTPTTIHDAGPEAATNHLCAPSYAGSFKGTQILDNSVLDLLNGLLKLLGLSIPATQSVHGTVTLTVTGEKDGKATVTNGQFKGTADSLAQGNKGTFTAKVTGTIDCGAKSFDGTITGSIDITVPKFSGGSQTSSSPFTGTITGPLDGGTWSDPAGTAATTTTPGTGSGTWWAKPP